MARLTSVDYEKTKHKLLEVGLASFELKGYNATGIQEIASQAGVSKGSFYSYFSSKADFGAAVISFYTINSVKTWNAMLEKAIIKENPLCALSGTFIEIITKNKDQKHKKGCLVGSLASEISEASQVCRMELNASINMYKDLLVKYIKLGQDQGYIRRDIPPENLATLIWDCWQGSLLRMKIEESIEPVINDLKLLFDTILPS